MTHSHYLRDRKSINWKELCYGESIVIRKESIVQKREVLPEEYHIERLIARKFEKHKFLYLVKWHGFPESDSTWEPTGQKGYYPENVTPYMHAMVYHVPFFVHKYGELRKFSGQAEEKLNDNIKTINQQKTNKFDCAMDTMKVRKRLEMLSSGIERPKRSYTKKKTDWWEHDIFRERNEKKDTVLRAIENADSKYSIAPVDSAPERDLDSLSTDEIKQKLLSLGVTTRLRKREKLLSLLKNTYEH